jgi:hypothetical protein
VHPAEAGGRAGGRAAALALALQALAALELDPYLLERPSASPWMPPRADAYTVAGVLGALALALFFLRRAWLRRTLWAGCTAGAAALAVTCPFNGSRAHAAQAVLLGAALLVLARLERGRGARGRVRLLLCALVLLAFELGFSFVARSHAVGYTLASRLWFARHWGTPNNSLGYRDVEHAEDGRPHLFVVGDSFVAGVGIADARERASDRLQELLGERYQVHNLGWNGADTGVERERLLEYPFRPSVLVLCYYVNDITGAAAELGRKLPPFTPYADLARPALWFVSRSYLLDFVYWLLPHDDLAWRGTFNANCFAWPEVVAAHEAELQRLVDWARERECRMIAVLFPDLARVEQSGPWLAPALGLFARNEVPVVDVRDLVRGKRSREFVVNSNDAHPNAWLHGQVAEAVLRKMEELGLIAAR